MPRSIESLESDLQELTQRSQYLRSQLLSTEERRQDIEDLLRLAKKLDLAIKPEQMKASLADVLARAASGASPPAPIPAPTPDRRPMKTRIIEAAEQVLSDGIRRFSRELLPELDRLGVVIEGRDRAACLSTILSREKELFAADLSEGGWTLVQLVRPAMKVRAFTKDYDRLEMAFQEFCECAELPP